MASIIIADENEGRRNLLANTFEREGYEDPIDTLAQTTATASAVLPDVLLLKVNGARSVSMCASLGWPTALSFGHTHRFSPNHST